MPYITFEPILEAARSKARMVLVRSINGIVGSNHARDMDECPPFLCCAVLCR
jgi:hypothetical protein